MADLPAPLPPARQPRTTPEERAQWVRRFQRAGLSQRPFAAQHGLGLATLQRWLRQAPLTPLAPAFTEVKLPTPLARWAAEVVRPDGWVVRLAAEAPPAWWAQCLPPC